MSFSGQELKDYNEKIVHYIKELKGQRKELNYLIQKQNEEKRKLETDIERITYKLNLINKSLAQRIMTREHYDKTILEAEENYQKIVDSSGVLLTAVQKEAGDLEQSMDKRTGTEMPKESETELGVVDPTKKTNERQISTRSSQSMDGSYKN